MGESSTPTNGLQVHASCFAKKKYKKASQRTVLPWQPIVRYKHAYTVKNPGYQNGLLNLILGIKVHAKISPKALQIVGERAFISIATSPKYYKWYNKISIDRYTGEVMQESIESDSERAKRAKKYNLLKSFMDAYRSPYARKKVSVFMVTLTRANEANGRIGDLLKAFKQRAHRAGCPLLGYVWVSEVSANTHWHYHLLFAVQRISIAGEKLPEWLKLNTIWGMGTHFTFAKGKGLQSYLNKAGYGKAIGSYLTKQTASVEGIRSVGSSRQFKQP